MTPRQRFTLALIGSTVLLASLGNQALAQAVLKDAEPAVVRWSHEVWKTAREGDEVTLERLLANCPTDQANEYLQRYRDSLDQLDANQKKADVARNESLVEAKTELDGHVGENKLTDALRSAIQVQDFSGDFSAVLHDASVASLIQDAKRLIPKSEAERDWLQAQELLFLVRTLYEDTDQHEEYHRFDKSLSAVNRRVGLLATYAPEHLHGLRVKAAERAGEEPLGEFNPATAVDWRERVADIEPKMLKAALKRAAKEHIETDRDGGWRLLIDGGLESLRIFATTKGLQGTFPTLADDDKVETWVSFIDRKRAELAGTPDGDIDNWALTRTINQLLEQNSQSIGLDREVIYHEFGDGAISRFDERYDDPYTEIIWPSKLRRFRQATEGNFIGVGILIRHDDKRQIMVVNPLEGTPAYYAGVKPNDLIVEVDDESAVGWSLNDAVDRITGPKGKAVTLGIKREGEEELLQIPIVRDVIKLRSVRGWWKKELDEHGAPVWDWFVDPVSRIGYVRLTQFTEDTYRDLRSAWREMNKQGVPNGLIVDLRYNPGGLLTSAVDVSNLFIQEGTIVTGEDKHGKPAFQPQRANHRHTEMFGVPTVMLINKGSASASEIVAGCLQAHGAAVVVGERSYGKGSVQTVHHIDSMARLKLTTHYYRLPPCEQNAKGRLVHKRPNSTDWGVLPDIEVKMTSAQVRDSIELRQAADIIDEDPNADGEEREDITRLLTEGMDPQLQTALLILQARALADVDPDSRHARK